MKTIQSFSLDVETALRLKAMINERKNISKSELAEKYIKEGLARDTAVSLLCRKCGASYSSKLSECPGCRK